MRLCLYGLCRHQGFCMPNLLMDGEVRIGMAFMKRRGLLKVWPADGPELLWSALDAGKGHTSPVIVSDRLYITGMNEDETREIFSAYTLTGKKVYEVAYSPVWEARIRRPGQHR